LDVFGIVPQAYLRDAVIKAARELRGVPVKGERRLRKLTDAMELFGLDPDDLPEPAPVPEGGWGKLAQVIQTDEPLHEAIDLRRFHDYLFEAGTAPARELWQTLQPHGPLLDVGGGTGAYSAAFPGEALIVDTPEVVNLAKLQAISLDILNGPQYPSDQGVVLIANVLHLFGERDCRAIVRKAAAALGREGMLVVKDLDRTTAQGVLFALNMALFTRDGDVHDEASVRAWMLDAGLDDPRRIALKSSPESLVLAARKP
jgi:hypothetical protein